MIPRRMEGPSRSYGGLMYLDRAIQTLEALTVPLMHLRPALEDGGRRDFEQRTGDTMS
jgi:hypothetical protein